MYAPFSCLWFLSCFFLLPSSAMTTKDFLRQTWTTTKYYFEKHYQRVEVANDKKIYYINLFVNSTLFVLKHCKVCK